VLTNV
jgi:hypothetical protein